MSDGPVWLAVALHPLWQVLTRIPGPNSDVRVLRAIVADWAEDQVCQTTPPRRKSTPDAYAQTRASASTTTIRVTAGLIGASWNSFRML